MYTERKILGVCSWLSEKFGLNVTGLRILFVVFLFLGIGSPFIVYLILYLIKPNHY
ncbi:MAG: PspC domain-containing protein [Flavobacteriales bacterium]|tara:strand:- start:452 stop:619 length:168 start_codon:yes stop_codon:yes gene_type:complete